MDLTARERNGGRERGKQQRQAVLPNIADGSLERRGEERDGGEGEGETKNDWEQRRREVEWGRQKEMPEKSQKWEGHRAT